MRALRRSTTSFPRRKNRGAGSDSLRPPYRDVTAWVDAAIEVGEFRDDARMERLNVSFARRYLDAEARGTEVGPLRAWT